MDWAELITVVGAKRTSAEVGHLVLRSNVGIAAVRSGLAYPLKQ
jgi:hypothetical protein